MSGKLTEEQLKRIEENKRKALAKRAGKSQISTSQNSAVSLQKTSFSVSQGGSNLFSGSSGPGSVYNTNEVPGKTIASVGSENKISKANGLSKGHHLPVSADSVDSSRFKDSSVNVSKITVTGSPKNYNIPQKSVYGRNANEGAMCSSNLSTKPSLDKNLKPSSVIYNSGCNSCAAVDKRITESNSLKGNIDYDRIEQNRLKALAKRAEKLNKSPVKSVNLPFSHSGVGNNSSSQSASISGTSTYLPNKTPGLVQNSTVSTDKNKLKSQTLPYSNTVNKSVIVNSSATNSGASINSSVQKNEGPNNDSSVNNVNIFSKFSGTPVKGGCYLISRDRFEVVVGYSAPLVEMFKCMKTKFYDAVSKKWSFKLSEYNSFMTAVRNLKPAVDIDPLPKAVLAVFNAQIRGENPPEQAPMADLSRVDQSLVTSLMSFQRQGVNFGINKNGRVLIADDMGLGKTIQAICLSCYYRSEWPLLVVVPSSVRFDWSQNFLRWVPSLDSQSVNVVVTGKENCTSGLINILSYDIMARKADVLKNKRFQVVIMDECHLLKNYKTARCKAAMPVLHNAKRVFLLSGTPAMSRPSELFTQIDAICPFLFKFHDFGVRYCAGNKMPWGWDYSGSSNMKELQILLEEKIMIRHLKTDVLTELPDKVRKMILLDPSLVKINKDLKTASSALASGNLKKMEEKGKLLDFFHKSGSAKMKAIKCYIEDLLECDNKFLIFAHHGDVLDGIEETVKAKIDPNYIRIDGKTNSEQRNFLCKKFQLNDNIRVAILSITAANAGLNLSSASLVLFAELFWNPGILVQAEDRAHRIGQQDMVNVQYLVARGTSDDHIWPMIQKKLDVLGKAGLSKDNFSSAETTRVTDQRQEEITKFLEESFCADEIPSFDEPDGDEVEEMNPSPSKEALKQSSILKYASPFKDLEQSASCSTPPKEKKPRGLFKYFSPSKNSKDNINQTSQSGEMVTKGRSSRQNKLTEDNDLGEFFMDSDEEWTDCNTEPAVKKRKT